MNKNNSDGKTTTASVYRLLQNPAPICMFYFAHPFGITSPATGAKLAQIRDHAMKGCKQNGPPSEASATATTAANEIPPVAVGRKPNKTHTTGVGERNASKSDRKINGLLCAEHQVELAGLTGNGGIQREQQRQRKHKKHHRTHRRISNFEKFLLEIQHSHTCGNGGGVGEGSPKIRRIDREDRLTPLVPWPSIIWNRDFLIPTLLQALAQQHGSGYWLGTNGRKWGEHQLHGEALFHKIRIASTPTPFAPVPPTMGFG
uniref:Uncharacterized protein n=1 Tax=Anopheles farauti TaxID=69004 RepID=A0A182Q604_9DIPT